MSNIFLNINLLTKTQKWRMVKPELIEPTCKLSHDFDASPTPLAVT